MGVTGAESDPSAKNQTLFFHVNMGTYELFQTMPPLCLMRVVLHM
jgi:hypothetical protein